MPDLYDRVASALGRVVAYSGFGGIVGVIVASVYRDLRPFSSVAYGEWMAYSAGIAGAFALAFEIARAL
ncbi:MAG: hypothetical protein ACYDHT_03175 [Solirubrobacteraceae bacterium]